MSLTLIFMAITVAAIAIFDVYIIAKRGPQESISAYIIRGSKKYPLVVLIAGVVLGHLFWSMKTADIYRDVECRNIHTGELIK